MNFAKLAADTSALSCSDPIPSSTYREVVEYMALFGRKWDPQIGDVNVLAPFAILVPRAICGMLFSLAERLSAELLEIETELTVRSELWPSLGLPRSAIGLLASDECWTPCAARLVRYDFHPTPEGWRISEVNSDVPGGMNEATVFTRLMAQQLPDTVVSGEPLEVLADALAGAASNRRRIAGVAAAGLLDDQQVVASLADPLRERGVDLTLVTPDQLRWENGEAYISREAQRLEVGAIFRFFQGEWANRVRSPQWAHVFRGGKTPVCNPAAAVLTESKRLPLYWDDLRVAVPTWREILPASHATWKPRAFASDCVHKGAYSNTGDWVVSPAWSNRSTLFGAWLRGLLRPRSSVAQARFETVTVDTPLGPMRPCLGVYTINGRACGIYGRVATAAYVDYRARDIAVLVTL